jgi:hypothetical protein
MMSFQTYITGFFMNFELLPIMHIRKKGDEIFFKSRQSLVEIGLVVSNKKIFK